MKPITVAIDTTPIKDGNTVRGVGTYTRNLLQALKTEPAITVTEDINDPAADIIHYPYFDFFFHTLPKKKKPTIITIHDVIPLLYPDYFPVGILGKFHFWQQKNVLAHVAKILTVSECSKKDIIAKLAVSAEKIFVTPLYANDQFRPQSAEAITAICQKYHLPEKFLLYVGDINYNKNLPAFIEAFAAIQMPDIDLVLVGKAFRGPEVNELAVINTAIEKSAGHNIIKLGFVDDADLPAIYSAATVYVQPSLYEGFGLPVLEAMACGTPVACAKASSLLEVAGEAAAYFNPANLNQMATTIENLLKSDSLQKEFAAKGLTQAAQFSKARLAKTTIAAYAYIQ